MIGVLAWIVGIERNLLQLCSLQILIKCAASGGSTKARSLAEAIVSDRCSSFGRWHDIGGAMWRFAEEMSLLSTARLQPVKADASSSPLGDSGAPQGKARARGLDALNGGQKLGESAQELSGSKAQRGAQNPGADGKHAGGMAPTQKFLVNLATQTDATGTETTTTAVGTGSVPTKTNVKVTNLKGMAATQKALLGARTDATETEIVTTAARIGAANARTDAKVATPKKKTGVTRTRAVRSTRAKAADSKKKDGHDIFQGIL
jgi:hypothetical protein